MFPDFFFLNCRITVEVGPGQCLYIPKGWYHEFVTDIEITVSYNVWFKGPACANWRPTCLYQHSEGYYQSLLARNILEEKFSTDI